MQHIRGIIRAVFIIAVIILVGRFVYSVMKDSAEEQKNDGGVSSRLSEKTSEERLQVTETDSSKPVSENTTESTEPDADTATPDTPEEPDDFEFRMSFVGDCCMATNVDEIVDGSLLWYEQNYPNSYFFEKVISYFEDDDLTVANCENAFSDKSLPTKEKEGETNYWFKAPARFASVFKDNSIEAVSIANNHSGDFGTQGYEDTKAALDYAGVRWGDESNPIYYEKDGFTVAIVCSNMFSYAQGESILTLLEEAKGKSDFQVVFFHGGLEGEFEPEGWIMDLCHRFVDGGADLVVGAHPHVLRKRETYNNVDIVYSLGNFCFGGNINPKPNRTIIYKYNLTLHHSGDSIEVADKKEEMIPCYIYTGGVNNWQPAPIDDKDTADRVIKYMNGEISSPE